MTTATAPADVDAPVLIDWTTTRTDRLTLLACSYCDADHQAPCDPERPTFSHVGRRWRVGITQPGMCMRHAPAGGDLIACTTRCVPTVEYVHTGEDGTPYRAACLAVDCEWIGTERDDENDAVDDAHDHTHPGWRDLPVVGRVPHDLKDKQRDAWRRDVNRIYSGLGHPNHLLLPGGIIRTERRPNGTRSHWSHTVGGYDICARTVTDNTPARTSSTPAAPTLF